MWTFLAELRARGFEGQLSLTHADRTVLSSDNSIYQVFPQAIAFPAGTEDLVRIATIAAEPRFRALKLAPRGGGTGTNGQSLTDGLVVDLSRNMNRILEIDPARRRVRVQSGVVKDQLNKALEPHGLFFAPELSTSNRATIGGMINTDACGQGSCIYGKTSHHVLALTTVLLDGTVWTSRPLDEEELKTVEARPDRVGAIHRLVNAIHRDNEALIAERFPKLNRSLTGYDLAHIRDRDGRFDLNAILCGAEGTLGFIAEAELNVLPIPKHAALVNIRYDSFDAALRDARALVAVQAASIETVDSRVLGLARNDIVWHEVQEFFPDDAEGPAEGINLVELLADDPHDLTAQLERVTSLLEEEGRTRGRRGFTVARNAGGAERQSITGAPRIAEDGDEAEEDGHRPETTLADRPVERIWGMRKKAVGLLGNMAGGRRPIPFVEDTAVPPEQLADYIAEFRAALDRRGLVYGMFGHVDAGVLHVRPAIDMTDPAQATLIREISDEVVALTRKYGGVLWGEHGKGVRSEYAPAFFGPLYPCLQRIKAAFDPHDQLNPGKIAAPADGSLLRIDEVPTRGGRERVIPPGVREGYDNALHCNGNGACYDFDLDAAMCPSWKGTRERRHSPKGRASVLREWLRLMVAEGADPLEEAAKLRATPAWRTLPARIVNTIRKHRGVHDFSHEVKETMDGCLACKACAGQCPIKVDVPAFRAKFLELYHGRYLRPAKDGLVGAIEHLLPVAARLPALYNLAVGSPPGQLLTRGLGLVALPRLPGLRLEQRARRARDQDRNAAGSGCPVGSGAGAQRRRRSGRLHQPFRARARARPARPSDGPRLQALAGAVPAQRQATARARLPRPVRARGSAQRRHAPRPGGRGRAAGGPRPVDDARLPLRVQGARCRRHAQGAACPGMACPAPRRAARAAPAPGAGQLPSPSALHGAGQRRRFARRLAARVPPVRSRADGGWRAAAAAWPAPTATRPGTAPPPSASTR